MKPAMNSFRARKDDTNQTKNPSTSHTHKPNKWDHLFRNGIDGYLSPYKITIDILLHYSSRDWKLELEMKRKIETFEWHSTQFHENFREEFHYHCSVSKETQRDRDKHNYLFFFSSISLSSSLKKTVLSEYKQHVAHLYIYLQLQQEKTREKESENNDIDNETKSIMFGFWKAHTECWSKRGREMWLFFVELNRIILFALRQNFTWIKRFTIIVYTHFVTSHLFPIWFLHLLLFLLLFTSFVPFL